MDLAFAKERMTIAYLEAQQDDLDLDKINMMIQFIEECDALAQPPVPEGASPGAAPAMPGLPPVEAGPPPGPPIPEGMPPMPPMPEGGAQQLPI